MPTAEIERLRAITSAEFRRQGRDQSEPFIHFTGGFVRDDGLCQIDGTFDMLALARAIQATAWNAGRDAVAAYVARQADALENDASLPPAQRAVKNGLSLAKDFAVLAEEIKRIPVPEPDGA